MQLLDVYVGLFCATEQSNNATELRHISQALFHSIHKVFLPPEVSGLGSKDSISLKKLKAGEVMWEIRKELLGWISNGTTI